jgi:type IV pilus assembly protein PilC
MATFAWKGQSASGAPRSGTIEANSKAEVRSQLRNRDISPTEIEKEGSILDMEIELFNNVPLQNKVVFTRQLATMIDAGLPLTQALDLLAEGEPNSTFQGIIEDVKGDVESGSTLADAMERHPEVFDELYVSLVNAGEVAGILDSILERLATQLEKSSELRREVKGAMTYPAILTGVSILVIFILLYKVIPMFQQMFSDMGGQSLPQSTQTVIDISEFIQANVLFIVVGVGAVVALVTALLNYRPTRAVVDKYLLKAPVIGPVVTKAAVARFTRTLGTMVKSGVPIIDSLDIVAKTAGNIEIEKAMKYVKERISQGQNMVDPLMETGVFPSMVVQMIGVGESTGALDQMLGKIADFYEDEVEAAIENFTSLLQPILMVVMGGIVGALLIAMYMPVFTMASNLSGSM